MRIRPVLAGIIRSHGRRAPERVSRSVFDLLVLGGLQDVSFLQARSMRTLEDTLKEQAPELGRKLGFQIKVRQ